MAFKKELSNVRIVDNTEMFLREMVEATNRALERVGFQAEGYAQDLAPSSIESGGSFHIPNLRQSITHKVVGDDVYIGTNQEYAPYVELGTGRYYKRPDGTNGFQSAGRPGWWVYVVDETPGGRTKGTGKVYTEEEARQVVAILRSKGLEAYATEGMEPQPYLRPAATDHKETYRRIIKDELSKT